MSKTVKIILSIFTFLPMVLFIVYFVLFLLFFFDLASHHMHKPEEAFSDFPGFVHSFFPLLMMILITAVTGIALMLFYIIHISQNQYLDSTQRLLWILIVIITSIVGQIIYLILEIWPEKSKPAATDGKII